MSDVKPAAIYLAAWNMNGGPMPDSIAKRLEAAFDRICSESKIRLATSVARVDHA